MFCKKKYSSIFFLVLDFLKEYYYFLCCSFKIRYHIEEVCTKTNLVTIRCCYSRNYIRSTLDNIINSSGIIEHLSPLQACWLGYYYSLQFIGAAKEEQHEWKAISYKLKMKKGRFKIISFDLRPKELTYYDVITTKVYKEKIIDLAQDEFVINNLDPTQACYIGMQTGFIISKFNIQTLSEKKRKPVLKIVK